MFPPPSMQLKAKLILALCAAVIILSTVAAFLLLPGQRGKSVNLSLLDLSDWQAYGGSWSSNSSIFSDARNGRGDMLLLNNASWQNFLFSGDIAINGIYQGLPYGDAGLVFRVSQPNIGVDSYNGYYAGLDIQKQVLIFGRSNYEWNQMETLHLKSRLAPGEWYHLSVQARRCRMTISAAPTAGGERTEIVYDDPNCLQAGTIGLRLYYVQASWKNLQIVR